jgi:hypothetical protein
MPAELHWLAVGVFSLTMTAAWLFAEKRIVVTSLLAGAGWSWMALTGDALTRYTNTGTEIQLQAGPLIYLCLALAVVSFLALGLTIWGHYPPPEDNPTEVEPNV